jgi:hypothetical protein
VGAGRQAWLQQQHEERLRGAIADLRSGARVEIVDPALRE